MGASQTSPHVRTVNRLCEKGFTLERVGAGAIYGADVESRSRMCDGARRYAPGDNESPSRQCVHQGCVAMLTT